MLRYILLLPIIFNSCAKSPKVNVEEIDAIKDVLSNQQICWNNGDIEGFMLGYWNSEKFKFSWVNGTEYGWENAFEHSSWIYKDTQKQIFRDMEYLIERGVEPLFAIKTMKADSKDMWYPRRKELEAAGVIRE